jgi:hypothetical protein
VTIGIPILIYLVLCGLVGMLAHHRGQIWPMWVLIAALISPLIAAVVLLFIENRNDAGARVAAIAALRRQQRRPVSPTDKFAQEMAEEEARFRAAGEKMRRP